MCELILGPQALSGYNYAQEFTEERLSRLEVMIVDYLIETGKLMNTSVTAAQLVFIFQDIYAWGKQPDPGMVQMVQRVQRVLDELSRDEVFVNRFKALILNN